MTAAVNAEAFSDVTAMARVAESLACLTGELRGAQPKEAQQPDTPERPHSVLSEDVAHERRGKVTTLTPRETYPQYYREGDHRLVKRAWSKKEGQPYEHRAPREIVDALLEAIRKRQGDRKPFEAGEIMPLYQKSGEEYPSYQAYLALGWLRHVGALAKGRAGYLLKPGLDGGRVAEIWESVDSVA